ncbi:acetolactate synthase large subunit [Bacillus subtilis subsp. subtilis]|uniref:Acetolactate synthase n=3 Tax=Bacillus subtilis subsp. subtilis TaxID=135461 RepID=ILVX_BACSU|nr:MULTISPECIES: acetolactate synthase AlsS [Bacillales]NP_391482.2 alpha-acetolactate synthase [Bacillus subtilis subsp. subtilis str. 168]Q04789.3 RecName: Full=Acetolactate synthase; AltName: Full=ALS; AltName: Full=Acetohydroxy-acid synthase [Bacillus subtilis subsp. subtilis str. 168]AKM49045.1 AlsS [synthetic construct]MBU8843545.1 acetolactate synthase AlsS [Alkalicoccobacillus gibsonii]MDP4100473.1 acetolactate synthase AlsS [Bacillota bacterium]BAM55680.1 acetolactate synthase [Bacil
MTKATKEQKSLVKNRGAELVVDCLVEQGVTHVFGIPGAKIDAVFDALQDKGPEIIVARHEQNAAFMAQAVGRLTGKPGVVLVTSGPGASNLATGLLTANTEGDPVVALAGNVIRADRLKRTHQSLDNAALFQPITKYSVEVQDVKNIPEAVTNAFRIASAGQAGAAFVSFPQDVVNEVTNTKNVRAVAAPKLGPAADDAISAAIAKIQTAKLPVVLVGMKGGRPEAIKAVRKLLKKVQLPFVETYQAAGTLSRDLEDQYFGRIGLFRNQPGDLLLEQADVVLTIGYDPIEYDPKFWNINGDRTIIHLDEIIADIDHAYQPDLELIGDIPSTINHIEHDAVKVEFAEREQKILSDLKQYMHEGEQVPADWKSDRAHPLEIVKELRNAVDDHVTVTCDIGSHAIWMSRYFRSYEPLTLMISNGMQTLGVALPWAIGASLVKPGEKVVSVSGDGGFLFSAMELETAVRLKAPIVHIVWNDSTYDMVAFQQLKKYNRTSAVDFGNIDIVKYAESFGATGLRVESPDQLADVLRQGMNAEGPVIIDVPVDYSDNINLASDKLPKEFGELMKTKAL